MNQTTIEANYKEMLESTLFRENAEYAFSSEVKVLGVSAKSSIQSVEAFSGEVKFSIKTVFRIVFCDKEGNFGHESVTTESVRSVVKDGVLPTSCIRGYVNVCDCSFGGVTNIKCAATVELYGWFIRERELHLLDACMNGVFCKTQTVKIQNLNCLKTTSLHVTFTDETRMNTVRLVDYCVEANVTNIYANGNSYRIEGDTYIRIFAQSEEETFSQLFSHSFTTEIEEEGITSSSDIDVEVTVKEVQLSVAEGNGRTVISDLELEFTGSYGNEKQAENVSDMYSITNEIKIERSEEKAVTGFCVRSLREKASSAVQTEGVNELYGVLCPCVTAAYGKSNGSAVEGVVQATVLYLNGKEKPDSAVLEIPYRAVLPEEYGCDMRMQPKVILTNITARARNGEIEGTAELSITVRGQSTEKITVVGNAEIGAEKPDDGYAMGLYFVRPGESLWDVAKALNASEEEIKMQNPEIALPLKGGEKIVFYREEKN